MKIALVTGASSGLGQAFARKIAARGEVDELWLIARREERLRQLAQSLPLPVQPIALDLTREESIEYLGRRLKEEQPEVKFLVNAAGFGKFGTYADLTFRETADMIDLNCKAAVLITHEVLPYMKRGGKILEICSSAAFQPLPGFNVYAAGKSFLLRYSRALRWELFGRGISVTAVCPGWVRTEFIQVAKDTKNSGAVKKFPFLAAPERVAEAALRDNAMGLAVSAYGPIAPVQRLAAKILPSSVIMGAWEILRR